MRWSLTLAAFLACWSTVAISQQPTMTTAQQDWLTCFISKRWCVTTSTEDANREKKTIAMVSSQAPLRFHGSITRATIQVTCPDGAPTVMLATGRPISNRDIIIDYRIAPDNKTRKLIAKYASEGHFFEIDDKEFLQDLQHGTRAVLEVMTNSNEHPSAEFNISGTASILERLKCAGSEKDK
jgi:hypothetical protein